MLKSLHIENFKAVRDADDIPLAPVTLIYGPNSGGKSSVIQALLLLKQSMDAGRFTARGSLIDLGSFHSCVWQHDVQKPLRLGVTVRGSRAASSEESEFDASWGGGPETSLWLTFRSRKAEPSEPTRVRLAGCRYRVHSKADEALDVRLEHDPLASQVLDAEPRFRFSGERSRAWLRTQAQQRGLPHAAGDLPEYGVFCRGGLLPHVVARRTAMEVMADAFFRGCAAPDQPPTSLTWSGQPLSLRRAQLAGILDGLRYIGPLRARATRTYSPLDNGADWVGSTGENAPQALLQGLVRSGSKELSKLFAHWLEQLDIPYKFHVRSVGDQVLGDGIRTTLVDQRTKVSVGLTDVGSGVGQVLPLLVQAAFGDAQTLCVEQPELHLHPRAQAALGDVLLESAGLIVGKKEPAQATQWVVETHSETLLLRIKRRIREKKVDPADVSVLYVEPSKSGSSVIHLRLNEDGDFIDDWPRGFFEEAFNEVFP
jgi:predicted ATPase